MFQLMSTTTRREIGPLRRWLHSVKQARIDSARARAMAEPDWEVLAREHEFERLLHAADPSMRAELMAMSYRP